MAEKIKVSPDLIATPSTTKSVGFAPRGEWAPARNSPRAHGAVEHSRRRPHEVGLSPVTGEVGFAR